MSLLLANLDRELASTSDPELRGELFARKAAYLGRVGRFTEADQIVAELRELYADGHSGRVSVWIMLAEGLIHHFKDLSPKALDRISRALLLGSAMRYRPIVALAAAWKGHIQFQTGDFDSMIEALDQSDNNSTASDLDANTRRAIVLCNAYMICGDRSTALKWFESARRMAVANGDQASLEALIYNRAAFLTTWLRAENCLCPVAPEALKSVRLEIASARNFQDLTGAAALTVHVHLWDARQCLLSGEFSLAIEKLKAIREDLPAADASFSKAYIDLEICFCLLRQGLADDAIEGFRTLPVIDLERLDVDEQLVAAWMRLEMARLDSRFGDVALLAEHFGALSQRYADYKTRLIQRLGQLRTAVPS